MAANHAIRLTTLIHVTHLETHLCICAMSLSCSFSSRHSPQAEVTKNTHLMNTLPLFIVFCSYSQPNSASYSGTIPRCNVSNLADGKCVLWVDVLIRCRGGQPHFVAKGGSINWDSCSSALIIFHMSVEKNQRRERSNRTTASMPLSHMPLFVFFFFPQN